MFEQVVAAMRRLVGDIRDYPLETVITVVVLVVIALAVALFSESLRTLARWIGRGVGDVAALLAGQLRTAAAWLAALPIAAFVSDISAFLVAIVGLVGQALDQWSEAVTGWRHNAWSALAGTTWVGWRVIGAVLYAGALAAFAWADAGLLLVTFEELTDTTVSWAPPWLRELALQLVVTSFLSAAMLGSVLLDLGERTHLGPWSGMSERWRWAIAGVALALLAILIAAGGMIAAWRADEVLRLSWLDESTRIRFAGLGQTLPILVMLAVTALIGWGAVSAPWVLWFTFTGVLWFFLRMVRLVVAILERLFGGAGAAVLQRLFGLVLGLLRVSAVIGASALDLFAKLAEVAATITVALIDVIAAPGAALVGFGRWMGGGRGGASKGPRSHVSADTGASPTGAPALGARA